MTPQHNLTADQTTRRNNSLAEIDALCKKLNFTVEAIMMLLPSTYVNATITLVPTKESGFNSEEAQTQLQEILDKYSTVFYPTGLITSNSGKAGMTINIEVLPKEIFE